MTRYEVAKVRYDASRPFAVFDTGRSWNTCVGRYATKEQAFRRACDMNRRDQGEYIASRPEGRD